ncbi:TerD family protein [Deinococcus sedimenti]|uniref:TerD domain-containing protein n=1 Tax=Deinococcus sedimenti TaxID=1867090 RepID=A0ABQ2S726_9DEIO|nr:TerD family protein [Deinococcus sedimenti]GGS03619.1 hypothetical protein GCM10008960_32670 [Deinococcus sedimenti]
MTLTLLPGERRALRDLGVITHVEVTVAYGMPDLHVAVLALDEQRHLRPSGVASPATPDLLGGAVTGAYAEGKARFAVHLTDLPEEVKRVVLVAGHDERPVAQAQALTVQLGGHVFEPLPLLTHEKAVVLLELYATTTGWRVAAVGQGHQGGWDDLLTAVAATPEQITAWSGQRLAMRQRDAFTEWEVQDASGAALLSLREAQPLDFRDAAPVTLSDDQKVQLGHALQGAVRMAGATLPSLLSASTYRLVLNPEMQKAIRGGAQMMNVDGGLTGFVRNAQTGRIMGAGHFRPDQLMRVTAVATVAFQVAAFVTAQYYLHAINQELKSIDRKLDGLQEFLDGQAMGRLLARLKSVQRNAKLLQQRPLDAEERTAALASVLELIHESESQVAQHELPMANLEDALRDSGTFKLEEARRSLKKHTRHMNTALFAAATNIRALEVGVQLGWAPDRVSLHEEDLRRSLQTLERATAVFAQALTHYDAQASARNAPGSETEFSVRGVVAGLFGRLMQGRRNKQDQQRAAFKDQPDGWVPTLTTHQHMLTQLQAQLGQFQTMRAGILREQQKPQTLILQLDHQGTVVQSYLEQERELDTVR